MTVTKYPKLYPTYLLARVEFRPLGHLIYSSLPSEQLSKPPYLCLRSSDQLPFLRLVSFYCKLVHVPPPALPLSNYLFSLPIYKSREAHLHLIQDTVTREGRKNRPPLPLPEVAGGWLVSSAFFLLLLP